jgi:hypothetical protein
MVSESDAFKIATSILKQPHDDPERPWKLVEFPQGWLISVTEPEFRVGAFNRVVERDSGRVLRFPSRVPPTRILADYPKVVGHARVELEPQAPPG